MTNNDELTALIALIENWQEENIEAPWVDDPSAIAKDLQVDPAKVNRALAVMDAQAMLYDADEMPGTEMTIEELFLFTFPNSPLHGKI